MLVLPALNLIYTAIWSVFRNSDIRFWITIRKINEISENASNKVSSKSNHLIFEGFVEIYNVPNIDDDKNKISL